MDHIIKLQTKIINGLRAMPNNFTKNVRIDDYYPIDPCFSKQSNENIDDIEDVTHPDTLKELLTSTGLKIIYTNFLIIIYL